MKKVTLVSRILLGVGFTIFGLNGFFHFLPQPPMQPGLASDYFSVLSSSHYMVIPFVLQLACGILFILNRYIPLALTLIAPVLVNILMFHGLMDPSGIGPGLLFSILWLVLFFNVRSAFSGILSPRRAI